MSGEEEAAYVVGIDLGTTHTALASVDLALAEGDEAPPSVMSVPQLVAQGSIEARALLPSFLYLPHASEGPQPLPWDATRAFVVGEHARARGSDAPLRVVSSAKSWLCHPTIDRRAAVLPPTPPGIAPEEVPKVSPVEASRRLLEHLRQAWDHAHGSSEPFAAQEVVLTVPASFDAGARELTAEAARLAGIAPDKFTLLEEPQAALYAWIEQTHGGWRRQVKVGEVILVVDVGGGTTDFSAIAVKENDGELELHRVAVGDHILLGGDNMDLALAHAIEQKLAAQGKEIDPWQSQSLVHAARAAKEQLLSRDDLAAAPIVIAGRGSKLLGGSIRTELTRDEMTRLLLEGFFPRVESSARPAVRARVGLQAMGLSYASDAAITRHLAAFLGKQVGATAGMSGFETKGTKSATFLHPSAVLFNGGVMKGAALRARVMESLNQWLTLEGESPARELSGVDLDLAVARGAAYYGYAKRGRGVRIRGGTARAYYVGIEDAMPAVPGMEPPLRAICVAPFGMEEGTTAALPPQQLGLVVGEPARFRFFGSTVRRDDRPGVVLERWSPNELEELPEIEASLPAEGRRAGEVVPVQLRASVTEVGTLLLEAVPSEGRERWRLELNVRGES